MPIVKFTKENKEIEVRVGENLRKAALKAGVNLYQGINGVGASINKFANCHGFGMCGMCRVNITKGMDKASEKGTLESLRFKIPFPDPLVNLAYIGNEETMRLACRTEVMGDLEVETGPEFNLFGDNFFS
jgi:ferredoxin